MLSIPRDPFQLILRFLSNEDLVSLHGTCKAMAVLLQRQWKPRGKRLVDSRASQVHAKKKGAAARRKAAVNKLLCDEFGGDWRLLVTQHVAARKVELQWLEEEKRAWLEVMQRKKGACVQEISCRWTGRGDLGTTIRVVFSVDPAVGRVSYIQWDPEYDMATKKAAALLGDQVFFSCSCDCRCRWRAIEAESPFLFKCLWRRVYHWRSAEEFLWC
jgi:hypothetical protein